MTRASFVAAQAPIAWDDAQHLADATGRPLRSDRYARCEHAVGEGFDRLVTTGWDPLTQAPLLAAKAARAYAIDALGYSADVLGTRRAWRIAAAKAKYPTGVVEDPVEETVETEAVTDTSTTTPDPGLTFATDAEIQALIDSIQS